ncbi:MAG: hypothetical protein II308_04050 [Muribaculaceae bacterium]|nr:hypothetical protein [Muribaculaceae bacterium]
MLHIFSSKGKVATIGRVIGVSSKSIVAAIIEVFATIRVIGENAFRAC